MDKISNEGSPGPSAAARSPSYPGLRTGSVTVQLNTEANRDAFYRVVVAHPEIVAVSVIRSRRGARN